MSISVLNTDAGLSGKTLGTTDTDQTVTGLKTFDRDPAAPFAVSASSAVVTNLDADKLDGQEGTYYLDPANLSAVVPVAKGGTAAATATANTVFAGAVSGGAAAPAFRALVVADISAVLPTATYQCGLYHATTQSVNSTTATAVLFNTEDFDTGGLHDTGANTSRVTVPSGAGNNHLWLFTAQVSTESSSGGSRLIYFRKNGTTTVAGEARVPPASGDPTTVALSALIRLSEADYVEVMYTQNSGGALLIGHGSTRQIQNSLQATKLT